MKLLKVHLQLFSLVNHIHFWNGMEKVLPDQYGLKQNKTNEAMKWKETWTEQNFEFHWMEEILSEQYET